MAHLASRIRGQSCARLLVGCPSFGSSMVKACYVERMSFALGRLNIIGHLLLKRCQEGSSSCSFSSFLSHRTFRLDAFDLTPVLSNLGDRSDLIPSLHSLVHFIGTRNKQPQHRMSNITAPFTLSFDPCSTGAPQLPELTAMWSRIPRSSWGRPSRRLLSRLLLSTLYSDRGPSSYFQGQRCCRGCLLGLGPMRTGGAMSLTASGSEDSRVEHACCGWRSRSLI